MIGPHPLLQVAMPPGAALGRQPVIGRHRLLNDPLKIINCDIGDKPRKGFAMKMDLTDKARGYQEICKNQVSDQLETSIVQNNVQPAHSGLPRPSLSLGASKS